MRSRAGEERLWHGDGGATFVSWPFRGGGAEPWTAARRCPGRAAASTPRLRRPGRECGPGPGRRSRPASALPAGCSPREGGERVPAARAPGRLSRLIPRRERGRGATAAGLSPPDRGLKMPRAGGCVNSAAHGPGEPRPRRVTATAPGAGQGGCGPGPEGRAKTAHEGTTAPSRGSWPSGTGNGWVFSMSQSFTVTGRKASTLHTVQVRANNAGWNSEATSGTVTTAAPLPAAPAITGEFSPGRLRVHVGTYYLCDQAQVEYRVEGKLASMTSTVPLDPSRTSVRWTLREFDWVTGDRLTARGRMRRASDSVWSAWSAYETDVAP